MIQKVVDTLKSFDITPYKFYGSNGKILFEIHEDGKHNGNYIYYLVTGQIDNAISERDKSILLWKYGVNLLPENIENQLAISYFKFKQELSKVTF